MKSKPKIFCVRINYFAVFQNIFPCTYNRDIFHRNENLLVVDSYFISYKGIGQKSLESRSFKTCTAPLL